MKRVLIIATLIVFAGVAIGLAADASSKNKDAAASAAKPGTAKSSSVPKVEPSGLTWYSYPEALKKSRKENKHLMVHFTAVWCGWCKKMERETYTDTAVLRTLNKDFICSKVWGDTDSLLDIDGYQISERGLSQTQFGVRSFPTLAFVTPEGKNLGSAAGYRAAPDLLKILDFIRERKYDTTRTQSQNPSDSTAKP